MACLHCHFEQASTKYPRRKESVFSPELRLALQARAPHAKQYAEFLLERITLEFQIACGSKGPWNFETFACLPNAIPSQSGLYILLLETPQTSDARFGPTGLDLYCGQAHGQQKNNSAWTGLPLRLKTYEQQSRSDTVKLQAKRECPGDRGKTLHIYMLCSVVGWIRPLSWCASVE